MDTVLAEMQKQNYDKIVVLPMYPHYASSSTGSSIQRAMEIISKWWVIPELEIVNQFYDADFYIDTMVAQGQKHDISSYDHIIMSYHGLPERHVDKVYYNAGDLCVTTPARPFSMRPTSFVTKPPPLRPRLVAEKLGLNEDDYTVALKSRLDNKWLTPFSDEVIETWQKQVRSVYSFSRLRCRLPGDHHRDRLGISGNF